MSGTPEWAGVLARVGAAATRAGRAASGEFSIEGTRLFERALRSEAPIAAALHGESYGDKPRERAVLSELQSSGVELHTVPATLATELTGGRTFGSVVGVVTLLVADAGFDSLPRTADLLVAVDVQDPGNVGALLRTAAASGAGALIAVGATDPYHPKAVRTSMGSLFKLPILERPGAKQLFEELREAGYVSLAAVPRGGLQAWSPELPGGPHAVLVGSEAHGLPLETQERCDARISLPQRADLDSYSVNAAAAMLLYELTRRRAH